MVAPFGFAVTMALLGGVIDRYVRRKRGLLENGLLGIWIASPEHTLVQLVLRIVVNTFEAEEWTVFPYE